MEQFRNLRIGEVLIEMGLIDNQQLEEVLKIQAQSTERKKLGEMMIDLGIIDENQMLQAMSSKLQIPILNLDKIEIDSKAIQLIPEEIARERYIVAYKKEGQLLYLATNDALDFYAIENIRQISGCSTETVLATKEDILRVIDFYYKEQEMYRIADEVNYEQEELEKIEKDNEEIINASESSRVVKLINSILKYGYENNASDIHIEPFEHEIIVRMRKDGVILPFINLNKNILDSLNVRIKILSNLDIAEKRFPQDGHFVMNLNDTELNLRVSFIPTVYGEKAVLRFLNSNVKINNAETFGMTMENYNKIQKIMNMPHGLVYITGPTGSGKTSTLYMMLESLMKKSVNISTIEDPVEKNIFGVNQMQINEASGLTFEVGLRALLRQDPDIIMVGETRDAETAMISARAAITGHLVVSTLHTNDAISTIIRLRDMGLENFMVSNSLIGSVSQRLIRTICPKCKESIEVTGSKRIQLGEDITHIYYGKGCPSCNNTGFKGRIAIHEVMLVDEGLREMITLKKSVNEIRDYLKRTQNYKTLKEQAMQYVKEGITTFEEMERVIV